MRTGTNEHTGQKVLYFPAKLKTINLGAPRTSKSDKKSIYYIATADVMYPNAKEPATVGCMLWKGSHDANKELFAIGAQVELEVQIDGEYKGNAKVNLPALVKFDVDACGIFGEEDAMTEAEALEAEKLASNA